MIVGVLALAFVPGIGIAEWIVGASVLATLEDIAGEVRGANRRLEEISRSVRR
jgi:hypothetical protein